MSKEKALLLLDGYRVLDLTEGGCLLGGKILGDYGADVIKVERPGGSPSRNIGPFYKDSRDPEQSLFWFAFNANKRGITLDIETEKGRELFQTLVATADVVIESFPPGYLHNLGLNYRALEKINPKIILTSITPFGQTGPYAQYKASDLTCWAMGGYMWINGDPDRAPVGISVPHQASLNGGAEAAAASLIAHWHRELTGEGQHVDVSLQQCVIWITQELSLHWALNKVNKKRVGGYFPLPKANMQWIFPCKDGYVVCNIWGGAVATLYRSSQALTEWLAEEDMAPEWLKNFDWIHDFSSDVITPEIEKRVHAPFAEFFLSKTKKELYEESIKRHILLAPVNTAKDLLEDEHLQATRYWLEVEHPELGDTITYPSLGVRIDRMPFGTRRRAPLIGEHNEEVYVGEIGLSLEKLASLKDSGTV